MEEGIVERIISKYPISELRGSQRCYLQKNKPRIRSKISKLVCKDGALGEHILECMDKMLKERASTKNPQFLPDLLVWLNQERWTLYEVKDNTNIEGSKFDLNL